MYEMSREEFRNMEKRREERVKESMTHANGFMWCLVTTLEKSLQEGIIDRDTCVKILRIWEVEIGEYLSQDSKYKSKEFKDKRDVVIKNGKDPISFLRDVVVFTGEIDG